MTGIKIPTPEKMQRYPWGATTGILFAACIMLVGIIVKRPACDSDDWKKAYQSEREKNDKLTTSLLVANGVIEKIKSIKDSTSKNMNNEKSN